MPVGRTSVTKRFDELFAPLNKSSILEISSVKTTHLSTQCWQEGQAQDFNHYVKRAALKYTFGSDNKRA